MKTGHSAKLLAVMIASALAAGCGSDDNNNDAPTTPENNAPVAGEVAVSTQANNVVLLDVLAAASDADGDDITLVADSISASSGQAVIFGDKISYYPSLSESGEISVSYALSDGMDQTQATATVTVDAVSMDVAYMGTQTCLGCHAGHDSFLNHGHNFKINEITNGELPDYPFSKDEMDGRLAQLLERHQNGESRIENADIPASYADVPYLIGGYHWKARWSDENGYVVAGTGVQFNNQAEEGAANQWGNYKAGEVQDADGNQLKPGHTYGCGNCHNTGYKRYDADLNPNRQWGLDGVGGTWELSGVQCEACHGAGHEHVATMTAIANTPHHLPKGELNITLRAQPRTLEQLSADDMGFGLPVHCGECHTRDGERKFDSASGTYLSPFNKAFPDNPVTHAGRIVADKYGLGKHHQTVDELFGPHPETGEGMGKHFAAGVDCADCHNPHKTVVNRDAEGQDSNPFNVTCTNCHTEQAPKSPSHANVACTTCHMPDTAKSAIYNDVSPALGGDDTVRLGDVKGHIFKIDLSKNNDDLMMNGFVYPALSRDQACGSCHRESFREVVKGVTIH
ncbi:Ig-like domain-containing protein [Paraferrimonas haliotis]|uniref:Ig-like domain-containing protein n=1 Tax=Paraferrimonas haliotis TaxID=2013866 RepID=UPI000BA9BF5E|nr:Ig-like domain-containing protein [Paraferrimonas haliotis]